VHEYQTAKKYRNKSNYRRTLSKRKSHDLCGDLYWNFASVKLERLVNCTSKLDTEELEIC